MMSLAGNPEGPSISTRRLRLRPWHDSDMAAFAELHADAEVMRDLGGPFDAAASKDKLSRYRTAYAALGICRWAVETPDGTFVGYAGLMPSRPTHPLGEHFDIGWRLCRRAWGMGYATEAANAALDDAFDRLGLVEVLAYTAPDNRRSQAVMKRLGLCREQARDFILSDAVGGAWRGLVWSAKRSRGCG